MGNFIFCAGDVVKEIKDLDASKATQGDNMQTK